jgi:hypothetical protein
MAAWEMVSRAPRALAGHRRDVGAWVQRQRRRLSIAMYAHQEARGLAGVLVDHVGSLLATTAMLRARRTLAGDDPRRRQRRRSRRVAGECRELAGLHVVPARLVRIGGQRLAWALRVLFRGPVAGVRRKVVARWRRRPHSVITDEQGGRRGPRLPLCRTPATTAATARAAPSAIVRRGFVMTQSPSIQMPTSCPSSENR